MDLRPPILVVADDVAIDRATRRITVTGVRHGFTLPAFPHTLPFGVYLFAGTLASSCSVEIFFLPSMTDDTRSLWTGRLEKDEIELAAMLPAVTFPEPGFFDVQAYLDGRRHAWTRIEVRKG